MILLKSTRYDKGIGDAWGNAVSSVKTGEKTKDEAISTSTIQLKQIYPEKITVKQIKISPKFFTVRTVNVQTVRKDKKEYRKRMAIPLR